MDSINVKMDIRGFIRFSNEAVKELKLDKNPYADLEIDVVGKRIAVTPSKTLKPTSFRFMPNGAGYLLYFKGAMNATGFQIVTGSYTMVREGNKFVFTGKAPAKKKGAWEIIACRNSVGIPMLSIDSRGTIIFDKRTSTAVETAKNDTMIAEYDMAKKTFKLTFSKKGFINVRTIASHANASFMGTLSSHGIALPKKSFRTECKIDGKVVTFSVAALVAEQKALEKAAKAKK
ncbi:MULTISPECIES: hypothetical protein [unclassified Fibrobacter]|jgi:hypothetical protein|uniref:hypothetical protein n=1 Tax=unclassified Fibrobacter TaxID=2634177 RepID=UPI0015660F6E|nr:MULTISPECIES: hypothetical protein [unclassified Fibrobacter]